MLAQIELVMTELAKNGGPWGTAAVLAWIGWRIWRDLGPSLKEWLALRTREVAAAERNATAREEGLNVSREGNKSVEGLTTAINNLNNKLTEAMNNGFKRVTDKIATSKEN